MTREQRVGDPKSIMIMENKPILLLVLLDLGEKRILGSSLWEMWNI